MLRFKLCIVVAIVLMITGVVIAAPSEDMKAIWTGAGLCWTALMFLWLASKVQPR